MGTPLLWIGFNLFVLAAIALDLGVFSRRLHKVELREAFWSTTAWVVLSLLFGLGVWHFSGYQRAIEFYTGYLIEKALSVDNLFLFLVIFRTFSIDERFQHRMLEWGIIGALVMRGIMIFAGTELIERFSWVMYIFGGFLVYAGINMLFTKKENIHPEQSAFFRFANKHLRLTRDYHGEHFFVRNGGKIYATPLFLVLLVVEVTDITLAIDSIPAIFGITRDPFVVYTSNVFAILGLRAMYFLLAAFLNRLRFLTVGLAFVLSFIGAKMIVEPWLHIRAHISLLVVAGMLLIAVAASLIFRERRESPVRSKDQAAS
jgi:tellurite resistance protein TerC